MPESDKRKELETEWRSLNYRALETVQDTLAWARNLERIAEIEREIAALSAKQPCFPRKPL